MTKLGATIFLLWSMMFHDRPSTQFDLFLEKNRVSLSMEMDGQYFDAVVKSKDNKEQICEIENYLTVTTKWTFNEKISVAQITDIKKDGHHVMINGFFNIVGVIATIKVENRFLLEKIKEQSNIIHFHKEKEGLRAFRMHDERRIIEVNFTKD